MTNRKYCVQNWRINRLLGALIACLSVSGLCCGGAQEPNAYNCDTELQGILKTKIGEYCDGFFVEQMESKVNEYRVKCPVKAEQNKDKFVHGLNMLNVCSENQRTLDALNQRCSEQIQEADLHMDCIGEECASYVDYVNGILDYCNDPALKGVYEEKAKVLFERLRVRTEEADSLAPFMSVYYSCNLNLEKIKNKNAKSIFGKTIKIIKKKGGLNDTIEQGSEMEVVRNMAFNTCGQVLQTTLEILTADLAGKLSDEQLKMNEKKWNRVFDKLTKLRSNLDTINSETFFPGSLELVDATINEFTMDTPPAE